jgi:hypothetical protein
VVETLDLLNNISEVSCLRKNLLYSKFISILRYLTFQKLIFLYFTIHLHLRNLIHSSEIDVSFKAAGILANLLNDDIKCWSDTSIDLNEISRDLVSSLDFKIK